MKRIAILLLALTLLACQPTPDEEAIINRKDGALEQAIVSTPVPTYTYEAPTRWEETYKIREQEVRVSADIELPDADQFPVTTITRRSFTPSDIDALLRAACPGDWTIRENEYSREELKVDLQNAAKGDYMGENEETGEQIWVPNEAEMQRIHGLIEQAPLEDSYKPLNAEELPNPVKTSAVRDGTGTTWYLFAKSSSMRELISLKRYRDGNVQMENWVMQGDATPGEPAHALENIRISEEDAIRKGDEAFLVPAWAFYMTSEQNEEQHIDMQMLLINALDGTYIYRSLGGGDDGKPDRE